MKVLAITRISTEHQDVRSLDEQALLIRQFMERSYSGPFNLEEIRSQGSGERLDRAEFLEAQERVRSRQFDVVCSEDLARICRRADAFRFAELCEDFGVRLITINDRLDTATDGWRDSAFLSTWHHERSNLETSQRIKRTLRGRFQTGGVVPCLIAGYRRVPGVEGEAGLQKIAEWEPIYDQWFRILEEGGSFAEVADWLNERHISVGPASRGTSWTGTMVGRITRNPLLKGIRQRNVRESRRINSTGQHRSVRADPSQLLVRNCPHLVFIAPDRFDRLMRRIDEINAMYRRQGTDGRDSREGLPRSRTPWPAQHAKCGICGRILYRTQSKSIPMLQCSGAQAYKCWNAVTVNANVAARKILEAILRKLRELPEFDSLLLQNIRQQLQASSEADHSRVPTLVSEIEDLRRRMRNLSLEVAENGGNETYRATLRELQGILDLKTEELSHRSAPPREVLFPTLRSLEHHLQNLLADPELDDPELARILHRFVNRLEFYPIQACNGGAIELRAHLEIRLDQLQLDSDLHQLPAEITTHSMEVDLFDYPAQIRIRSEALRLTAERWKQRDIARHLGTHQATVQRAISLERAMQNLGLSDPYIRLTQAPQNDSKIRRHLHPRYSFEPLAERTAA
ncbi:recombinase family protein [Telmatocola sphagniphila]|uniref:Recombinase family protein n=1 Tax=Telmatocola sphagniphila TaxID=1123043 RepID=A0A8E6B1R2_9BACT|nr:recombinase family protein [Telmatocola sphagniphila]